MIWFLGLLGGLVIGGLLWGTSGAIILGFIGTSAVPPKDAPPLVGAGNAPDGDSEVAVAEAPTACR